MDVARDWRGSPPTALAEPAALDAAVADARAPGAPRSTARAAAARCADVLVALVLLVVASPLILCGALAVRLSGGAPVFFGHQRLGRGGRPFRCWKLRTMHEDAEERLSGDPELRRRYLDNGFKLPTHEDPRVHRAGRWLRRMYVDELPQLWNVIRGDMSLVGPRPIVAGELALFGEHAPALLSRRPGVFGEWTSRGRRRPPYPERVRVEMEYVNDPTLRRSLRILARSIGVVAVGQGEEG